VSERELKQIAYRYWLRGCWPPFLFAGF